MSRRLYYSQRRRRLRPLAAHTATRPSTARSISSPPCCPGRRHSSTPWPAYIAPRALRRLVQGGSRVSPKDHTCASKRGQSEQALIRPREGPRQPGRHAACPLRRVPAVTAWNCPPSSPPHPRLSTRYCTTRRLCTCLLFSSYPSRFIFDRKQERHGWETRWALAWRGCDGQGGGVQAARNRGKARGRATLKTHHTNGAGGPQESSRHRESTHCRTGTGSGVPRRCCARARHSVAVRRRAAAAGGRCAAENTRMQ